VLTQDEGHGDETGVVVAINCQLFKIPLLIIIQAKSIKEHNSDAVKTKAWIHVSTALVFPKAASSLSHLYVMLMAVYMAKKARNSLYNTL